MIALFTAMAHAQSGTFTIQNPHVSGSGPIIVTDPRVAPPNGDTASFGPLSGNSLFGVRNDGATDGGSHCNSTTGCWITNVNSPMATSAGFFAMHVKAGPFGPLHPGQSALAAITSVRSNALFVFDTNPFSRTVPMKISCQGADSVNMTEGAVVKVQCDEMRYRATWKNDPATNTPKWYVEKKSPQNQWNWIFVEKHEELNKTYNFTTNPNYVNNAYYVTVGTLDAKVDPTQLSQAGTFSYDLKVGVY